MENIKLKNCVIVTEDGFLRKDIVLSDGLIDLSGSMKQCQTEMDLTGKYIVPGFVDIHFHGYNGFSFTLGKFDQKTSSFDNSKAAYEAGFEMLSKQLAEFGVTKYYIASYAAPTEALRNCFTMLAEHLEHSKNSACNGAKLLGGFVEGSFINPNMAGAQNPEYMLETSVEAFESIDPQNSIKLANIVPDFGEQSIKLIEYLAGKGIIVGAGHTNATCDQFAEAMKAGLTYCVHFTNGPTGSSYKPFDGGGATEAVLKFDEIYAELLADGYHINPAYIRDIIARKGIDKIIGSTDCGFVGGTDLKKVNMAGVEIAISECGNYIKVANKKNTLAGSNLVMKRGFKNILNWLSSDMAGIWNKRHPAMSFEEAVTAAAKMYSTNPCKLIGLDADGYGTIKDGGCGDLCVLDITGAEGDYKVDVAATIVDGKIVYSKV